MKMINFWQSAFVRFLFIFFGLMYIFPIGHIYSTYDNAQYVKYCQNTINTPNITAYCNVANEVIWAQEHCKELFAKFLTWLVIIFGIEEGIYQFITKHKKEE